MTKGEARVLLAAAAWTLYVWISRVVILAGQEESAAFKVVHFVLAGISIAFALAIARIGLRHWRSSRTHGVPRERRLEEGEASSRSR
ncbi:MAG: hypothetical protein ACRD0C_23690 [Acidimicrobiia bacterium]